MDQADTESNRQLLLEGDVKPRTLKVLFEYYFDHGANIQSMEQRGEETDVILVYKGVQIPFHFNNYRYSQATFAPLNTPEARKTANDKLRAGHELTVFDIPAPIEEPYTDEKQLEGFLNAHGKIVVKPSRGTRGDGVSVVGTLGDALAAVKRSSQFGGVVMLQQFVEGDDYRLLFVDYIFVAALKRIKPFVVGDGVHTVQELIAQENIRRQERAREQGLQAWRAHRLSQISEEEVANHLGQERLSEILAKGQRQELLKTANISKGALCEDVTDKVNVEIIAKLTPFLKAKGLGFCGVDIISPDISSSEGYKVIELNAGPGFLPHCRPDIGQPQPVGQYIAEALYEHWKRLQDKDK